MWERMPDTLAQPEGVVNICTLSKVSVHFESSTVQESIGFAYPKSSGIDFLNGDIEGIMIMSACYYMIKYIPWWVNYLISVETWNFHDALGLQWTLFFFAKELNCSVF